VVVEGERAAGKDDEGVVGLKLGVGAEEELGGGDDSLTLLRYCENGTRLGDDEFEPDLVPDPPFPFPSPAAFLPSPPPPLVLEVAVAPPPPPRVPRMLSLSL
jgi:hypothetical protein